jgi:hypothetical protein
MFNFKYKREKEACGECMIYSKPSRTPLPPALTREQRVGLEHRLHRLGDVPVLQVALSLRGVLVQDVAAEDDALCDTGLYTKKE